MVQKPQDVRSDGSRHGLHFLQQRWNLVRRYWLLHQASWISTQSDSLFPLFNFKKWFLSCKQPFGGPNFFAVEPPVVLIVHRAGAAARLRPVRCLERGEEINNQWPELRQQQQPHTAADLAVVSAQSSTLPSILIQVSVTIMKLKT